MSHTTPDTGGRMKEVVINTDEGRVLRHFQSYPRSTIMKTSETLGIPKTVIHDLLLSLESKGLMIRHNKGDGQGKWLPPFWRKEELRMEFGELLDELSEVNALLKIHNVYTEASP